MNWLASVNITRSIEERVVAVMIMVMMMVVVPIVIVVPRISPRAVPRVIPSCPIWTAVPSSIPIRVINPWVIEPSSIEPRVIPSGIIGRAVDSPVISVRRPCISVAEAHERIHVNCRDVRVLKVESERLRCLCDFCPGGRCAVTRIEYRCLCQIRERIGLLLALREVHCGRRFFRPRVIYSVILTCSLCHSSTGRHHDAACRQRQDSRHS